MAPQKVIVGGDEEPYGIETDLWWSIVGYSPARLDIPRSNSICHRLAVEELPPADAICILESDFKDTSEESKNVSQDDILFLNKMEENIKENNLGHYEMPLPFKERPALPNNTQLVMTRLNHPKRRLSKDKTFHRHDTDFMNERTVKKS